jgi:quercetin dioxygenase-like cupin family protein
MRVLAPDQIRDLNFDTRIDGVHAVMQVAPREISNSATRERIVIRTTAEESGGELLAFELFLPPGGHVPARHAHPHQQETFTVISGELEFHVKRRVVRARAGEVVVVAPRCEHWFGNRGALLAHALVEVRPALRMESLLEASAAVTRQPRLQRLSSLARLLLEFQAELAAPIVPAPLLRVLLAPFAGRHGVRT